MKASHRKDVIIARLIFAAICLFLIALIVTIVITVNSKGGKKKEQDKVQQNAVSESETDSAGDSDTEIGAIYLPQQTTEGTEKTYVTTTSSVNMREKPTKSRSQRFADAIILLTMAAILAAGCLTFADYGFTLDEATERRSSVITYQYVLKTLLGHELRVVDTDLADHRDRYYGVALQLPLVAAEHLAHFNMAPRNIYQMRHLYTFLICWLGYVCFFFFCKTYKNNEF